MQRFKFFTFCRLILFQERNAATRSQLIDVLALIADADVQFIFPIASTNGVRLNIQFSAPLAFVLKLKAFEKSPTGSLSHCLEVTVDLSV